MNTQEINPTILNVEKVNTSFFDKRKKISFPKILTPDLAEEIGIHLGDGFLSKKRNEYRLKGGKDEKEYYGGFVKPLYKKLFNIDVKVREYESTYGFEEASQGLWKFKTEVLGIPAGRKDTIRCPEFIKNQTQKIQVAFIRGLFDTDGSVSFLSKYGYKSYYPCISLTSKSKFLIEDVKIILTNFGLNPKVFQDRKRYWCIYLNGYERLARYSRLIGWDNPKYIKKINNWKERYPKLGEEVMVDVV